MNGNGSITEQLLKKLGYQNEQKIFDKTNEFLRLLDLKKSSKITISDYAKTVLCINFAADFLKLSFDYEDGIKASGLKKSAYQNYKRTLEKILDLKKPISINEICVQLNLNETQKYANKYFDYFCKINLNDIDTSHPQYAAMAVFQAAKKMKKKILKAKILSYSHLKPSQWTILEQQWNKIVIRYEEDLKKLNINESELSNKENINDNKLSKTNNKNIESKKNLIEDFDTWKGRLLKMAQEQFKLDRKPNEPELLDNKWLCNHYLEWEDDSDYFMF